MAMDAEDSAAEKLRRQQRMDLMRKVEEENAVRLEPLGCDRRHNRYWRFVNRPGDARDPGESRASRAGPPAPRLLTPPLAGRRWPGLGGAPAPSSNERRALGAQPA
jgi:hypothetical protein